MPSPLRPLLDAQIERHRRAGTDPWSELAALLDGARSPDDVRRALLRDRPVLASLARGPSLGPDPADLREEAVAAGVLDASLDDLAFRRLFPTLDRGVYCASHAMGLPSIAWVPAVEEAMLRLHHHGIHAWAGWLGAMDAWRAVVATLCGADLRRGDVIGFPNFSEGLSALLRGLSGRLVTDATHFTTARYVHAAWAERTGSPVVEVAADPFGVVSAERIIDALTADTAVVSVSHVAWRTGYVLDVEAIAEAMSRKCPGAALLVDVYQSQGTVPLDTRGFPERAAVLGGGIKQLHAGPGAAFAWISLPLIRAIEPDRTGWWAHQEPLAFAESFEEGPGIARLRTGTPNPLPMVGLLTEARVLASSAGGDLAAAIARARRVTGAAVNHAARVAEERGLSVAGARHPSRRGAFFAIRVRDGEQRVDELATEGVFVDYRAERPGADRGLMRLSSNAAGFPYELEYAVERVAERVGR